MLPFPILWTWQCILVEDLQGFDAHTFGCGCSDDCSGPVLWGKLSMSSLCTQWLRHANGRSSVIGLNGASVNSVCKLEFAEGKLQVLIHGSKSKQASPWVMLMFSVCLSSLIFFLFIWSNTSLRSYTVDAGCRFLEHKLELQLSHHAPWTFSWDVHSSMWWTLKSVVDFWTQLLPNLFVVLFTVFWLISCGLQHLDTALGQMVRMRPSKELHVRNEVYRSWDQVN